MPCGLLIYKRLAPRLTLGQLCRLHILIKIVKWVCTNRISKIKLPNRTQLETLICVSPSSNSLRHFIKHLEGNN
ncbi:hypothetical protein Hanom_Chr16g01462561 [Helianthus anomalus]